MSDLGPSWDAGTIKLLLGLSPDDDDETMQVEFMNNERKDDDSSSSNTKSAKLTFANRSMMHRIIHAYDGLVIPMTHGYHYYKFSEVTDGCCDTDGSSSHTPPLHLQLMALPTSTLECRVQRLTNSNINSKYIKPHKKGGGRSCKIYKHASLAYELSQLLGNSRQCNKCFGAPVPVGSTDELLKYLRLSTLWPPIDKQRKGVSADNYLTVRKQHPPEHDEIWSMCQKLINKVVPDAVYNALAITKMFRGSPHVDNHDQTFQHVIALGDFDGGCLCTEANDDDGTETFCIDVKDRFGRIDGRNVHWVSAWSGERYSIVYYSTSDDHFTKPVPQIVHNEWMARKCKKTTVPQRIYSVTNTNLPKHLPLVGLGCSSFSSFFSSGDDNPFTVDTISKDHPIVIGWIETIRHAVLNRGINLLDTAPWYGHGTSEIVVGYALDTILSDEEDDQVQRKRTGSLIRSDIIINTKVCRYEADPLHQFDFSYATTMKSVQRSLERLNCGYIDVLQLHDPEFAPSIAELMEETLPALIECKHRGWTKALGITGYPLDVQHEILVRSATVFPGNTVVFDQSLVYCHNNLHDMSLFHESCFSIQPESHEAVDGPTAATTSFADFCEQSHIHLMAAAPLSMGLLTHSGPPEWHPASSALKQACHEASKLCENEKVNISSLAILYALAHPRIGCTLLGMKDVNEINSAADLASRFSDIKFDQKESHQAILNKVLTPKEREVLEKLQDMSDGPFSQLGEEYRWDGRMEASNFWAMVNKMKQM